MNVAWKNWNTVAQESDRAEAGIAHPATRSAAELLQVLKPVMKEVWGLFDRYISEVKGDLPWWYTERSLIGFLHAAASRLGWVAMQEYRAYNRKSKKGSRFPDWWFRPGPNREYVVQAKFEAFGPGSAWATIDKHLIRAAITDFDTFHVGRCCRIAVGFCTMKYAGTQEASRALSEWLGHDSQPVPRGVCDAVAYYVLKDTSKVPHGANGERLPGMLMLFKRV